MRVAIAGGTGFIGKFMANLFNRNGWNVTILSRSSKLHSEVGFAKLVQWNPEPTQDQFDHEVASLVPQLDDINVVINLAGENPADARWTDSKKEKILNSRLSSIRVISEVVNKLGKNKTIYIQSSAAGIYGNRGEEILLDDSQPGKINSFRINCVKQLEKNTREEVPRAVLLRIGHVLGPKEGIFPFLKLSSVLRVKKYGSGGQYIPWVHVQDVASAAFFIANNPQMFFGKTVNMASPGTSTYDQFYQTMEMIHNRKPLFTIPEFLLRLSMGELSSVILQSQQMYPKLLLESGFEFQYKNLGEAISSKELLE